MPRVGSVQHALWVDIREPGGGHRRLLFDAQPPHSKRLREARLRELIACIWPDAEAVGYSGGVGRFEVGSAAAVAHFAPVRAGVRLLPIQETDSAFLRDNDEAHVASGTPEPCGVELQLRLL
jgi:hypothetical protein